ncbi:MAG: NADH-quinone oxidoreductase subunit M [Bacteroidota bacterium]
MNQVTISFIFILLIFLPLAGIPFIVGLQKESGKYIALGIGLISLILSLLLYANYDVAVSPETGYAFMQSVDWISTAEFNIKFSIGLDGISVYLFLLSVVIFPLLVIYSWNKVHTQEKTFYCMLLMIQTGILGFFVSLDLLLFYVFFELVLIPSYFFIGIWGGAQKEEGALRFFLYTLAGSLLMLVAIMYMGLEAGGGMFITDYFQIMRTDFGPTAETWLFLAFMVAFAIKVPLFPLHTWQPITYSQAPITAAIILSAILSKMGTYGILRFAVGMFPETAVTTAPIISLLALISIIYGAIMAIVQTDLRKLIAYSSISHLGFIILGIFSFSKLALSGAVLHMVGHGLSTAAMFMLAGILYERYGTYEIEKFSGVAKSLPKMAVIFLITLLASVGLPGLSGFIGEFMILVGAYDSTVIGGAFAVLAAISVILAAVYLLNMFRKIMFGVARAEDTAADLNRGETGILIPLIIGMFWIGLNATAYLNRINPDTDSFIEKIEEKLGMLNTQEEGDYICEADSSGL